ncbi:MAG: hypothetical protein IPO19_14470 [Rhodoferax sp.]|nr:hypothetical protein [Rhodoferax sp.]
MKREDYEHYACGMYLAGTLAFLEGRYGSKPWKASGRGISLDEFLAERDDKRKEPLQIAGVCVAGLDALVCIRNAVTHNDGDLSKNIDSQSLSKVSAAALPGVQIVGNSVRLSSGYSVDFMKYVRESFVAVSMLHGGL